MNEITKEILKEVSDYIAGDNDSDGVALFIKRYFGFE